MEFHKEQKVCGTHVHADPVKAKHHARILAEEHKLYCHKGGSSNYYSCSDFERKT